MLAHTRPDIDFVSGTFWGSRPDDALTWLRRHDPVHWDGAVWGLTRHADVRAAARRPDLFSSAGGARPEMDPVDHMLDMDDPDHARRRKLVSQGFTPRRVAEQEQLVRELTDEILDQVCARGECDLVRDVAAWLPVQVIGRALGFAPADYPTLLDWSDTLLGGLDGNVGEDRIAPLVEAFTGYVDYLSAVITDRRAAPLNDLISVLVHARADGDRLSEAALIHESLLILVAGDETSRHVLTGGVYQLLRDRDQWEALRADRSLLTSATEEMLRWVTPIKNIARTLTRDTEVGGKELRAGDTALLLFPSANRDEDVFADPFRFDIRRTPNDHLAFGLGSHFCLGNALARLEIRVMTDRLLERLPDLELSGGAEPASRAANFVTGYESMPVRFTPTAPLREGSR